MRHPNPLIWSGIKGRNGTDSPLALAPDEVVDAVNVTFGDGALAAKRKGCVDMPLTSGPTTSIGSLIAHGSQVSPDLFAFGNTTGIYRLASSPSSTWASVTAIDAPQTEEAYGVTLNGKLFLAYNSAQNRLHCWDGSTVRRVGLFMNPALAPTAANTGAGAYAATFRTYRVAWARISGSDTIARSELSSPVGFTPSGAGTAVRVTRPTAPGEGETHWLLYGATGDVYSNYKLLSTIAIATTTYDDSTAPASYSGDAPQIAGMNNPPPAAKYIISDGNRLLMAGAWENISNFTSGQTEPRNCRVWYTRVLGSSDIGDDETIPNTSATGVTPAQKNWLDVGEDDGGGAVTGLGIVNGVVFVFKQGQTWRLLPTGDDLQPYRAILVSASIGSINHAGIVAGEDGSGAPVLYFYSRRGPYSISTSGELTYIGRTIEDWVTSNSAGFTVPFSVYHVAERQWWLFHYHGVGVNALIYHVRTGGWSDYLFTEHPTAAVMYPDWRDLFGSGTYTEGSALPKPWLGGNGYLHKADADEATEDDGVSYQAYITSRPFFPAGLGKYVQTHDATLVAKAQSGASVTLTLTKDFGLETRTASASLTASGSETRVVRRMEDSGLSTLGAVQLRIGDTSAVDNAWELDALSVPFTVQEAIG